MRRSTPPPGPSPVPTRAVLVIAFDGVAPLDVTGPISVFATACRYRPGAYQVTLASPLGGTVATTAVVALANPVLLCTITDTPDTVLVAGGDEAALLSAVGEHGVADALKSFRHARRVGSVCTGAFILAAAGLLSGRRVTTHWQSCALLARVAADAEVVPDAIFAVDGNIHTSAGVTSGMDLALAMVEADHGVNVATQVARELVLFLRRPGGQSQFSNVLQAQDSASHPMRELVVWMTAHPTADLHLEALARRAHMSERNFRRVFTEHTGMAPAAFVERLRVDRAQDLLQRTDWSVSQVARGAGFGSEDAQLKAFRRHTGATPAQYRARFGGTARTDAQRD